MAQGYPQYDMAALDEMPTIHFEILHDRLKLGEYRRHLPTATLLAQLLNALGGKSGGKSGTPAWKLFEAEELLPSYALPSTLHRDLPFTPSQCRAVMSAIADRELPSWAVQVLGSIMPMSQIMRYGGVRRGETDEQDGFEAWLGGEEFAEV